MERVIRAALSMKHQYTATELAKPFVVPRIDFSPDYNDPQVRNAMIENGVKSMATLFGSSAPAAMPQTVRPFEQEEHIFNVPDEQEDFSEPYIPDPSEEQDDMPGTTQQQDAPAGEPENHADSSQTKQDASGTAGSGEASKGKNQCAKCHTFISKKVYDFSIDKYGEPLCFNCQGKEGGK
jgi:hypothetical protein